MDLTDVSLLFCLATIKIAQVTVSWEPDAARTILALAQQRREENDDGRPFIVGVVGIPGSGTS